MNKRAAVINWEFWKNKKQITLWEAILLSLDLNPKSKSYQGKELNKELRKKEIAERLNLLKDTLKRKRDYILGESGADFQNSDCVDIGQFSAWCICAELSTPDPLHDIAVPIKTDEEIPLTNNLDSLHKLTEAYFGRSGSASPDVIEEIDLRARERRRVGLYTLEEAAFYVGENLVVIPKTILIKFIEASRNGDLIVYMPGGVEKYKPDVARPWYEESFWNDLNDWLGKNEPRIGCRFPNPNIVVEKVKNTDQGNHDWITEAITIANREGKKRWDSGMRQITARNICDKVATELAKDSKYDGNRGARIGGTIRNVALKGWKFIPPKGGTNGTSGTKE